MSSWPLFSGVLTQLATLRMVDSTSLVAGLGLGVLVGWLLRREPRGSAPSAAAAKPHLVSPSERDDAFKLVLVVRMDLKMGKGKVAAQCSHATLGAYKQARRQAPEWLAQWERAGQAKVVLKTEDESSLYVVEQRARQAGLVTAVIQDAGRTQIAPGSLTVLGVGPAPTAVLDEVTGHLKLL